MLEVKVHKVKYIDCPVELYKLLEICLLLSRKRKGDAVAAESQPQNNQVNPSKFYRYNNKTVGDPPEFTRGLDCYGFSYLKLYVMTILSLNFSVSGR